MKNDYKSILNELEKTVLNLWKEHHYSNKGMLKGQFDVVTETDLKFEEVILNTIYKITPNIPILSEETLSDTKTDGTYYTVDPVDGTWNYSNNIPIYGTQISLVEDGEPVIGLIYLPKVDQMYLGSKGNGSYLNGKQIFVDDRDPVKATIGIADIRRYDPVGLKNTLNLASSLASSFGKTRLTGASCFGYAMVSCGAYQARFSYRPHLWDVLPGILLTREAGGVGTFNSEYAIAASSENLLNLAIDCYKKLPN